MVEAASRVNDASLDFWCAWLRQREDGRRPGAETRTRVLATLIVAALTGLVATRHDHGDMAVVLLDNLVRFVRTSEEGARMARS